MKALFILTAVVGFAAASALQAADATKSARAEIIFDHPENFKDVKDMEPPTDKGRDAILRHIREYLVHEADSYIPEGDKLTMTFTDIDLAGEFVPGTNPEWNEIRIVKDVYPPAFKFTWQVTDASGKVVRQGREDMRVLDFATNLFQDPNDDQLHFEKAILRDWMRDHMRGLK